MHRPSLLHLIRRILGRPNLRSRNRLLKRQPQTPGRPLRLDRLPMRLEPRLPKIPLHPLQPIQHQRVLLHRQLPNNLKFLLLELPLQQQRHPLPKLRHLQHHPHNRRLLPHKHQRNVRRHRPHHGRLLTRHQRYATLLAHRALCIVHGVYLCDILHVCGEVVWGVYCVDGDCGVLCGDGGVWRAVLLYGGESDICELGYAE